MPNRRRLTITFQRSITAGRPNTMEVTVLPLTSPSSPALDGTLVGGPQTQTILLGNAANPVFFDLVPSDHPELAARVLYRIGWRERYLGRQYTHDFVMPDADVDFDDLDSLEAILGGETYVQWTDVGTPGGVAGINELGQVLDGDGNPVLGGASSSVQNLTASDGITKVEVTDDGVTTFDLRLDPGRGVRKWTGPVLPGSGNFGSISHDLNTIDVLVQVYRVSDRMPIPVTARPNLDGTTIAVEFTSPPTSGQYRAVVIG